MSLFKGAGVALITPFNEDNSVNYEMLRTLVKRQIDGGTDAIIVCGTTGEPATMTEEEKLSVIKCVVDETARQIPVIAGTGANCTQNVIDFSQKVEKLGVDAGETVTFDQVLAVNNGELSIGCPTVAGATVTGTVVKEAKAKKVIVYKYKRKSGYHKKNGHRQLFTEIKIDKINA